MKKLFFLSGILAMIVLIHSCGLGRYEVFKLEQQNDFLKKEGMFYFLPRTVLNIEVTVEKTDLVKGPYAAWSAKYLGISNVITQNTSTYNIVDIKIRPLNEPDPDKIFYIVFPKLKNKKSQLLITLKENGIIESVNIPVDSMSTHMQQIRSGALQGEFEDDSQPFKMFINYNILEKLDTLFEYIHLDTITIQKQIYRKSTIEKDAEQRAKETSDYIVKLNKHKVNLLSGYQEIGYSESTMHLMVTTLDQMISEYMSLFTGKTITQSLSYNFTHVPESSTKTSRLFMFSIDRDEGLSDIESKDMKKNIYLEFMPSLTTSKIAPVVDSQYSNSKKKKGFYYNIPEKTKMILSNGRGETIFETNVLINQYGIVHYLPAKNYKILFFDNSASLRQVK